MSNINENEKTATGATNTSDGNKSFGNGSDNTSYLFYSQDNENHVYTDWAGNTHPMKGHVRLIVPFQLAQRMHHHGPQLVTIDQASVEAQAVHVRQRRAEKRAKELEERRRKIRSYITEDFADELDAIDAQAAAVYRKIDAAVAKHLGEEDK